MLLRAGSEMIQAHEETRGTVLELHGSFGPAEADRLRDMIRRLEPQKSVTIDFREVRLCHDTAVARLARDLVESHRQVSMLGLSEHHRRLLRYIGLPSAQPVA